MKRSIVIMLVFLLVISVTQVAFAASDPANTPISAPFVDVPTSHWAYAAVAKLAKDHIIEGYNDRTFKGDRPISRYEMAKIVADALAKEDQASAEDQALIDKLSGEFAQDLKALNVRVDELEKKVDKFNLSGFVMYKYDHQTNGTYPATGKLVLIQGGLKFVSFATYRMDDNWSANLIGEFTRDTQGTEGASFENYQGFVPGNHDEAKNLFISGKINDVGINLGHFHYADAGYGWVYHDELSGVQLAFGKVAKFHVTEAYLDLGSNLSSWRNTDPLFATNVPKYQAVDVTLPLSKSTKLVGAFHDIISTTSGVSNRTIAEFGGDSQLSKNVWVNAVATKADASENNKSFLVGVKYGNQDFFKPGSWDAFVRYSVCDANAYISSTPFLQSDPVQGAKGYDLGFEYTPALKQQYSIEYLILKGVTPGSTWKDNFLRVMWNFALF